jgi:hypothetical protein
VGDEEEERATEGGEIEGVRRDEEEEQEILNGKQTERQANRVKKVPPQTAHEQGQEKEALTRGLLASAQALKLELKSSRDLSRLARCRRSGISQRSPPHAGAIDQPKPAWSRWSGGVEALDRHLKL